MAAEGHWFSQSGSLASAFNLQSSVFRVLLLQTFYASGCGFFRCSFISRRPCGARLFSVGSQSEAVDEWLILSKRNFKFDLGDILLFLPSVGLGHMMSGVTGPWLSQLMAGLKAEEDEEVDG